MEMYRKSIPFSNRLLREHIKGGTLLDVGGAECAWRANELADQVDRVVLLDVKDPVHVLKKNVDFLKLPIEEITAEHGTFRHVLLSNLLEHLHEPKLALEAVEKVLDEGGAIHILQPNCESLNRRVGVKMGILKDIREIPPNEVEMGHVRALSVSDIKEMLKEVGLELCACRGVFLKPVPTPEMVAWPEVRIKAYFELGAEFPPEWCHEVYFRAVRELEPAAVS